MQFFWYADVFVIGVPPLLLIEELA